jgi:multicomponent Na+:H+ antiporter subunit G
MFAAAALRCSSRWRWRWRAPRWGPPCSTALQAANTIGTSAMLLLAVFGFLNGRPEFLDLAMVYGLLNVVGVIAVLKFFRHGDLGADERRAPNEHADRSAQRHQPARRRRFFCLVGAVGLLRMPDFYTRMHAASVLETLGAGLMLLGLLLQAGLTLVAVKLLMIGLLIFFASPTASHALARAALSRGLKPLATGAAIAAGEDASSKP